MRVMLFGFDEFGERVAEYLGKKDLSVVVFDDNEEKRAKNRFFDVIRLHEIDDDELLKLEEFDIALAVLRDEDKNLFLSLSLKDLFPARPVIAKVSNKENEYKYKLAGVNKIINPYDVTANRIMTILKKPLTLKVLETIIFEDNNLSFAEIEVPEGSFLVNKYIKDIYKEISSNYNILIVALVDKTGRENVQFITKGVNFRIYEGDILIVVGDKDEIERFKFDLEFIKIGV
ncbi:MAG: TrkA family potassium uptake protein [Epsilonproteobacteria bacterium]|nr:TrkA family potassium uptake protein [Campylobacterota bacterium]